MANDQEIEDIRDKMRVALPHLRHAMSEARKLAGDGGKAQIGIIVSNADTSGRIVARFEAGEFLDDIAKILGLPTTSTEDEEMGAKVVQLLDSMGLRR